jgi:hypothetical protein
MLAFTALLLLAACEDTPPSGTQTLEAPTQPVFFTAQGRELLAFIDQGRGAVRFLDLTAGTYQWGTHPYFPREVSLDATPIALHLLGAELLAMSASGQVYTVPSIAGGALPFGLPEPAANAHPVALFDTVRVDSDCAVIALADGSRVETPAAVQCKAAGDGLVTATFNGSDRLLRPTLAGVVDFGATPFILRIVRGAADGGYWCLGADLRRLARLDGNGVELRRFGLTFDVMDLVEVSDDDGPLLALVGIGGVIVYLRPDGVAETPHGSRVMDRLVALRGDATTLSVRRAAAEELGGDDLLFVAGLELGSASVSVAASPDGVTLVAEAGAALAAEEDALVTLTQDQQICTARRAGGADYVVVDGTCPLGGGVQALFRSSGWNVFAGASITPDQTFEPSASSGSFNERRSLDFGGHTFSASAMVSASGAIAAGRGKTGAGSKVLSDGWLSAIATGTAVTHFAEAPQPWLWVTSPSQDAVIQLPIKAVDFFSMLVFK